MNIIDNLREFYYYILYYKSIHPIRFWAILLLVFLLSVLVTYLVVKAIKKYRKQKISNTEIEKETELKDKFLKPNPYQKVAIAVVVIQAFIIVSILLVTISYNTLINPINENTYLSSSKYIFGIDISHYQGVINWNEVRTSHHPIEFIFIRATMGSDGKDYQFKKNWTKAKEHGYLRGAYHYYRPNENSVEQFDNFKNTVSLNRGDFIPILDVEKESKFGKENLQQGVLNWLKLAEQHYGVKPMVYTGLSFYKDNLKDLINDYPLWIAAYSGSKSRLSKTHWSFHQFTENVRVKGVRASVDGNDFKGDLVELYDMCIQ